jgi:hypothetical protein
MTRRLTPLLFVAALLPLSGCGTRLVPVSGVATLDGKPLAEVSVTFISEDGKYTSSGMTDESGNFTLAHTNGPGAYPGTYKVTVTKYAKVAGYVPGADAGTNKEYEKHMKKEMDASKKAGIVKSTPMGKMGAGIQPPTGSMPMPGGGAGGSAVKSELPEIYASIEKTPFTIKVPPDGPVQLDLKSKP